MDYWIPLLWKKRSTSKPTARTDNFYFKKYCWRHAYLLVYICMYILIKTHNKIQNSACSCGFLKHIILIFDNIDINYSILPNHAVLCIAPPLDTEFNLAIILGLWDRMLSYQRFQDWPVTAFMQFVDAMCHISLSTPSGFDRDIFGLFDVFI